MRFRMLLATLLLLLAACGGGGTVEKRVVAFYGDSITEGTHSAKYNEWLPERWLPTPVEHIASLADIVAIDYSVNGGSSRNAFIKSDNASIVVIRFGVADTVYKLTPEVFGENITRMVAEARSFGKRVVLTGLPHTADLDTSVLNTVMKERALALNVGFVDIYSLPFDATTDLADTLHPAEGYSRRIGEVVAKYLKEF